MISQSLASTSSKKQRIFLPQNLPRSRIQEVYLAASSFQSLSLKSESNAGSHWNFLNDKSCNRTI